jgi:hypothetical protein
MRRKIDRCFGAAVLAGVLFGLAWPVSHARAQAAPLARWTQFTADGGREERSIYPEAAGDCPAGAQLRAGPARDFGIRVCAKTVPGDPPRIDRIVIFGDTGCRVKGSAVQPCDDTHWPLARIAARAADKQPDLVIHVGDYLYRETCPNDAKACPTLNVGNRWATWNDDFFAPARALLERAPWIIVRGNHEICGRPGGPGWAMLLAPDHQAAERCAPVVDPYRLRLGGNLALIVADSAADPDARPLGTQAAKLAPLLAPDPPAWLLTHKPFVSPAAFQAVVPDATKVALVVSGHVHDFGSYRIGPAFASQLIVGTGGTALHEPTGFMNAIEPAPSLLEKFGYLLLVRAGDGWTATLYGPTDQTLATCTIKGSRTACTVSG